MDKDLLNEFGWIVDSFDRDRDGSLDDSEAMFAMNALGVMAEARSDEEEQSLYEPVSYTHLTLPTILLV